MPREQEAQEVARGDRFDFRAQATDRVMMDARKQSPIAPLFRVGPWSKPAAQREAFDLERDQCAGDIIRRQAKRFGQRSRRDRSETFEAATNDFGQRFGICK